MGDRFVRPQIIPDNTHVPIGHGGHADRSRKWPGRRERESTTELIDRRVGPTQQISGQKGVIESFIFLLFL